MRRYASPQIGTGTADDPGANHGSWLCVSGVSDPGSVLAAATEGVRRHMLAEAGGGPLTGTRSQEARKDVREEA